MKQHLVWPTAYIFVLHPIKSRGFLFLWSTNYYQAFVRFLFFIIHFIGNWAKGYSVLLVQINNELTDFRHLCVLKSHISAVMFQMVSLIQCTSISSCSSYFSHFFSFFFKNVLFFTDFVNLHCSSHVSGNVCYCV